MKERKKEKKQQQQQKNKNKKTKTCQQRFMLSVDIPDWRQILIVSLSLRLF